MLNNTIAGGNPAAETWQHGIRNRSATGLTIIGAAREASLIRSTRR